MEDTEKNIESEHQKAFFAEIKKTIPNKEKMVNVVSDLLGVCSDSAYRRIRGKKLIDFEEAIKLSRRFKISIDTIVGGIEKNKLQCEYIRLEPKDLKHYSVHLKALMEVVETTGKTTGGEIHIASNDIPIFNLLFYKDLSIFKLYTWYNYVFGFSSKIEEFIKIIENSEITDYAEKITQKYQLVPSTEIWTNKMTDSFIKLITYHYEIGNFGEKKTPILICEQLVDMLNKFEKWGEKGNKGQNEIPFKLYLSELDFENSFIIFKRPPITSCLINMFTFNAFNIYDEIFCEEANYWFGYFSQHSSLISSTSRKTRETFFNGQREKIAMFIDKIQKK